MKVWLQGHKGVATRTYEDVAARTYEGVATRTYEGVAKPDYPGLLHDFNTLKHTIVVHWHRGI